MGSNEDNLDTRAKAYAKGCMQCRNPDIFPNDPEYPKMEAVFFKKYKRSASGEEQAILELHLLEERESKTQHLTKHPHPVMSLNSNQALKNGAILYATEYVQKCRHKNRGQQDQKDENHYRALFRVYYMAFIKAQNKHKPPVSGKLSPLK